MQCGGRDDTVTPYNGVSVPDIMGNTVMVYNECILDWVKRRSRGAANKSYAGPTNQKYIPRTLLLVSLLVRRQESSRALARHRPEDFAGKIKIPPFIWMRNPTTFL